MKVTRGMLAWSIGVGAVAGIFGIAAQTFAGAVSMEPLPPLLGQPYGYQSIQTCSSVVCAPVAVNDLGLALADYAIYFAVGLTFTLLAQIVLALIRQPKSWPGKTLVPLSFLLVALLVVSGTANSSIAVGASLSQPHWPTPSGIEVRALDNVTLYSGTASTLSHQGTAHLDITFVNYYWAGQTIPISVTLTMPNGSMISAVYHCASPSSCFPVAGVTFPKPYSAITLNQPTTAFYFGSAIVNGAGYKLSISQTGMTQNFGTTTAL